jgi:hypothetical protein
MQVVYLWIFNRLNNLRYFEPISRPAHKLNSRAHKDARCLLVLLTCRRSSKTVVLNAIFLPSPLFPVPSFTHSCLWLAIKM